MTSRVGFTSAQLCRWFGKWRTIQKLAIFYALKQISYARVQVRHDEYVGEIKVDLRRICASCKCFVMLEVILEWRHMNFLTRWRRSCRVPFPHSFWRGPCTGLEALRRSSNNRPRSWSSDNGYPKKNGIGIDRESIFPQKTTSTIFLRWLQAILGG